MPNARRLGLSEQECTQHYHEREFLVGRIKNLLELDKRPLDGVAMGLIRLYTEDIAKLDLAWQHRYEQ